MAITSLDELIAAPTQRSTYIKTATRTTVAAVPYSIFDLAGLPTAGTMAVGNTTTGVVPTDATTGYPPIDSFVGGNIGYLAGVHFGSSVACRITIFDCLYSAGAFGVANTTLSAQPSYAGRVPNGNDFKGLEIWVECATVATGTPSFTVTYTNQDGVAGRSTGTIVGVASMPVGRMLQLPLQTGDTGVQRIESVNITVATGGTFNVHVMRRLWQGRVRINNDGDVHDFTKTGMPQIFDTSALRFVVATDSTSSGIPELQLEIVNG